MSKSIRSRRRWPRRMVACEVGPNYTQRDALGWWLNPADPERYLEGQVELGAAHYWVDSGRTGLALLLQSLEMAGERVIIQGFSCVVVPNAVRAAGMRPVVVDVEAGGYNLDLEVVEEQAKLGVRVVVVQHTYGIPVEMDRLMEIVERYEMVLIEDMAHALGNRYNGRLLGTYGYGAVYSFGRDKVVSSGTGGLVVLNDGEGKIRLRNLYDELPAMKWGRVWQQVYYLVVVTLLVRPLYHWQVGKVILKLSQILRLIGPVFSPRERTGTEHLYRPSRYSRALKKILTGQLKGLSVVQAHRLGVVARYNVALGTDYTQPLLRYPQRVEDASDALAKLRRVGVIGGTWYNRVFIPTVEARRELGVREVDLPEVQALVAGRVVNLPTHINVRGEEVEIILDNIY